MSAKTGFFFGEKVVIGVDVVDTQWLPDGTKYPYPQVIIPKGTEATFISEAFRPGLGRVNVLRVKTPGWRGWCVLTDAELRPDENYSPGWND